jgi:uncharacterized protein
MTDKPDPLDALSSQLESQPKSRALPPVEKWNPPLSGDIDIVIRRDGTWLHEGTPILRKELVRLFSTILKREGDDYFLVTPVEKWRIQVEDVPLHAVALRETIVDGLPALEFETLTDDRVIADVQHPLRVDVDPESGEPSPYIRVRANLDAVIARSVFYQLVDRAEEETRQDVSQLFVTSAGQRFLLGRF